MKSWKTTAAGVLAALAVIFTQVSTLLDVDPLTNPSWDIVVAQVMVMIGFITARDNDVTSEESGATEAAHMRSLKRR